MDWTRSLAYNPSPMGTGFIKMHGLGNDFVVIDARRARVSIGAAEARAIADRTTGVGCDQVLMIEPAQDPRADAFMRIRNADGGEVEACGNGLRCVAHLLMGERGVAAIRVETAAGVLDASAAGEGRVTADLGPARLGWAEIPLAHEADTLALPIAEGPLERPVAVNVGNPHAVFFVPDAEAVPLERLGPRIENHPLFPERTNVEACHVAGSDTLRMRVWERGVGITRACGTGAAAAAVAAARRALTGRRVGVLLDGGRLDIHWREADGHVLMTGPVAVSFTGTLDGLLTPAGACP
jgi:diaminopimelate epimerase